VTAAPAGATPPLPTTGAPPEPRVNPVHRQVASAVAKDAAAVLAEAVAKHDEPDDVLHELLRALKGCRELSGPSRRAIDAALLVLDRAERTPAPVQLAQAAATPSPNGTPAATAA
jgi:hypothetical protein